MQLLEGMAPQSAASPRKKGGRSSGAKKKSAWTRCLITSLPPELYPSIFAEAIDHGNFVLCRALLPHTLVELYRTVELSDQVELAQFAAAIMRRPWLASEVRSFVLRDIDVEIDEEADGLVWDKIDPSLGSDRLETLQVLTGKRGRPYQPDDIIVGHGLIKDVLRLMSNLEDLDITGVYFRRHLFIPAFLEEGPWPRLKALRLASDKRDAGYVQQPDQGILRNISAFLPTLNTLTLRSSGSKPQHQDLDTSEPVPAFRVYADIFHDFRHLPPTIEYLRIGLGPACPLYDRSVEYPKFEAGAWHLPQLKSLHLDGDIVSRATFDLIYALPEVESLALGAHTAIEAQPLLSLIRGGPSTWPRLSCLTVNICSCSEDEPKYPFTHSATPNWPPHFNKQDASELLRFCDVRDIVLRGSVLCAFGVCAPDGAHGCPGWVKQKDADPALMKGRRGRNKPTSLTTRLWSDPLLISQLSLSPVHFTRSRLAASLTVPALSFGRVTMTRRRAARHYTYEPEEDKEQIPVGGRQLARGGQVGKTRNGTLTAPISRTDSAAGAVRRAPSKRLRGLAPDATSTPLSPILSSTAHLSPRKSRKTRTTAQPRLPSPAPRSLSLADLPTEILERIGEHLLPVISPSWPDGSRTLSKDWTGRIKDLLAMRSTCKATWTGLSALVHRCWSVRVSESVAGGSSASGLDAIVKGRGRGAFVVPASRIRHFSFNLSANGVVVPELRAPAFHNDLKLLDKMVYMYRLESFAYVYSDEDQVVERSPYQTKAIDIGVLEILAELPLMRDLYFCGVRFEGDLAEALKETPSEDEDDFDDGEDDGQDDSSSDDELAFVDNETPFPALRRITLNTCDDSMLQLLRLNLPLEEVRIWRDFATPLNAPALTDWWPPSLWQTVEEVDVVGMTGATGRRVLDEWLNSLILTRSLQPPVFVPLRSLRISEPHELSVIRRDILLSFALLPQLRHLTFFVWNERTFGPNLVKEIHEALPDLEELGIGLESEQLSWWQGSLHDWSTALALFRNLRVFTWNYSPYADLDFDDTRRYATPLVRSTFFPQLPNLVQLRWFGHFLHLRRDASTGWWDWSDDDPRIVPPLPAWAEERLAAKEVKVWSSSSTGNVKQFGIRTKPRQPLAELEAASRDPTSPSLYTEDSSSGASTSSIADWLEDAPDFEDKYGPMRRSETSMLDRLRATKAAEKGKGRAVQDEEESQETLWSDEEAGDDSGFLEASRLSNAEEWSEGE
ncbi:hypothetical protein RTBOTA2_004540 [Rhodotorula toruloides]|nr:hypothetical protein RTBOTA2_004540 [Rhodotorula toruloides]